MKRKKICGICLMIMVCLISCVTERGLQNKKSAQPPDFETMLRANTVRIGILEKGQEIRSGSGFVIQYKNKHYVVTNAHVVGYQDRDNIVISKKLPDGKLVRFYNASVVVDDEDNDVAVLIALNLDSMSGFPVQEQCSMLDSVLAAGFPGGAEDAKENDITFSTGKISNPLVKVDKRERIKLDIAVNPGNSGGPLVNGRGEVLGVIYMKYLDNIAYAIPISQVLKTIDSIEEAKDEKIIARITKAKVEKFMQELIYNPPDSCITAGYFTLDFRTSVELLLYTVYALSQSLVEKYELPHFPGTNDKYYKAFKIALLKLFNEYDVFPAIGLGTNTYQKYRLINLGYDSLYSFFSGAGELNEIIKERRVSETDRSRYLSILIAKYLKYCSKILLNDIVYAHFGDTDSIVDFEVVKISPENGEEPVVEGIVRIHYMDRYENVKLKLKYSRGKWAIYAIGNGVLGDTVLT